MITMMELMCVAIGGAVGSMLRYIVGSVIGRFNTGDFPYGTFAINISGSFLMGIWIGSMALLLPVKTKELHLLVAIGMLGGYTTFSTFSLESYMLIEKQLWGQAAVYIIGSVVFSVAAVLAGMWCIRSLA